jgi:flagellar biosynthetic protein FliP
MNRSLYILFALIAASLVPETALAVDLPTVSFGIEDAATTGEVSAALQVLFVLTILSVAPAILLMMTSFTRIVIVLAFVKMAMGTQNIPPRQVIIGISLFLTFFIMAPVFNEINDDALQPYLNEEISQDQAFETAVNAMRGFMFSQVQENELQMLIDLTDKEMPEDQNDISTTILIPAFMLSELKVAFQMGFMIYVPFLVIDMLVASVLMSMGMMMLPPIIISLPFKLLLFVLVDGWHLVVGSLMQSFN